MGIDKKKTGTFFSIVVPVYNAEKCLEKCISSVRDQTHKSYELILVDDGSVDQSSEICDRYAAKDSRIKVIHQKNAGQTSARKKGVEKSSGEYVLFLDSDDWVTEDALETCSKFLEMYETDLLVFGYQEYRDGTERMVSSVLVEGYYDRNAMDEKVNPCLLMDKDGHFFPRALWGKAFKRSLIEKSLNVVPEIIRNGEDMCCNIAAVLEAESMFVIDNPLYIYRIDGASVSKSGDRMALKRCEVMAKFLNETIEGENELLKEQYWRLLAQQMYSAVNRTIRSIGTGEEFTEAYKGLLENELCRLALQNAKFSLKAGKPRIKQFILRNKMFWIVKYLK